MGRNVRDYARYGSIGISWVMASLVYVYLGYRGGLWLDNRWQTDRVFTLVGILLGIGLSIYSLLQELQRLEKAWRRAKTHGEEGNKERESK